MLHFMKEISEKVSQKFSTLGLICGILLYVMQSHTQSYNLSIIEYYKTKLSLYYLQTKISKLKYTYIKIIHFSCCCYLSQ